MSKDSFLIVKNTAKLTLLFLPLLIFSYLYLDKPIAWYFHDQNLSLGKVGSLFLELLSPMANLAIWPVLFFILRFLYKNEKFGNIALFVTLSVACTNLVGSIIKILLGRVRPEMLFVHGEYGFQFFGTTNTDFSFPSGHACTIGAVLASLACMLPRYFWFFPFLALLISMIRVLQGVHFFSDITAGVLIAFVVTPVVFTQMRKAGFLTHKL